jgi:cell division septal protein FtsQ
VKESFTAAIVVRSLCAALGVVWLTGVLVGWVVVRLAVFWPVSWDVVVAVDIKWFLFFGL